MRIFNLPQKHGYQAPLALVGGVLGGTGALGGSIGALGGAAIGGALGGAMSKPKNISAPTPRSYLGEMQDALRAQSAVQGDLLSLERQYTPQYQQLQKTSLMGQLGILNDLYGQTMPQAEALQSQMLASQGRVYGGLGQQALNAYRGGLDAGTMGLYNTIQQQAQTGLDAGYGLTPEMQAQAQQSARAAMSARGLAGGGQGVAQEVLNSYSLGQNRYQTALANATNAYGLGINQSGNAYNQYGQPLMNQIAGVSPTGLLGQATAGYAGLGAKLFQPESQYNAGIYGANQSNEMNTRLANQQAQAGYASGLMSMAGSLGSAVLKNPNLFGGTSNTWTETGGGTVNGISYSPSDW